MGIMAFVFALAPAISLSIFWLLEFPGGWRARLKLYRIIPPWVLTILIILIIGNFVSGVLGPISAFVTDIVLSLVFIFDKKALENKEQGIVTGLETLTMKLEALKFKLTGK